MKFSHSPIILATLLAIFTGSSQGETLDFGPLLIRTQAPLQSDGVSTRLRDASATTWNEWFVSASMASVWADTNDYTLDYYQNDYLFGGQFALNPNLKLELSYLYRFAANNHLDSLSMEFHDLVGMSQNGRDNVDKHRFYIRGGSEEVVDFQGDDMNKAWELYVEQVLVNKEDYAVSLGGTLYYNHVSSGAFAGSSFEQAAQLNFTGRINSKHIFHSMLSVAHRSPKDYHGLPLEEWTFNWAGGYQYRWSPLHALLIEYRIQEGEVKKSAAITDLNEHTHELTLGYRLHLDNTAVELSMMENLINMDNSADIAFSLGIRHKY